jgi:hypothetical protein
MESLTLTSFPNGLQHLRDDNQGSQLFRVSGFPRKLADAYLTVYYFHSILLASHMLASCMAYRGRNLNDTRD